MRKTILKWGIAILVVSGLSLAAACSGQKPNAVPAPTPSVSTSAEPVADEPDCDLEDIVTRDSDCGFKPKTTKPPTTTTTRKKRP